MIAAYGDLETVDSALTTTSHSQWKGSLAYYNGTYYYATTGTPSVAMQISTSPSEVSTWLLANKWAVAE